MSCALHVFQDPTFCATVFQKRLLTAGCNRSPKWKCKHARYRSERILIWYIYLHLVDVYGRCSQICHTWKLWRWNISRDLAAILWMSLRPEVHFLHPHCHRELPRWKKEGGTSVQLQCKWTENNSKHFQGWEEKVMSWVLIDPIRFFRLERAWKGELASCFSYVKLE